MTTPAPAVLSIERDRREVAWSVLEGGAVIGSCRALSRPDRRCFVSIDTWRTEVFDLLLQTMSDELEENLFTTVDEADGARLEQWSDSGFTVNHLEHEYLIPTDPDATGLGGATTPPGIDVVSAAQVEVAGLRRLDEELRTAAPAPPVVSENRFYGELAGWWPLISPPEEYEEEAEYAATLLNSASIPVRTVLELGSGGGHNAVHLKAHFALTLVDLSEQMLAVSRLLNPECEHHRADMRTLRLDRSYDAVFVHDAVDYMTSEQDLRLAIRTAHLHCRPGGIALFVPDHIEETFVESSDSGGTDAADGRGVRFLDWTWDPDPADNLVRTEYAFLLRDANGDVQAVHETHTTGLFGRELWLRLLTEAGFSAQSVVEQTTEERIPRELFVGHRSRPTRTRSSGGCA